MDRSEVIKLVEQVQAVPAGSVDRAELMAGLAAVEQLARWAEDCRNELARELIDQVVTELQADKRTSVRYRGRVMVVDRACVVGLVDQVFTLRAGPPAREELRVELSMVERIVRWAEALRVEIARELAEVTSFPEADIAEVTGSGVRDATRTLERAGLVEQAPAFGDAMAAGEVAVAHVDALGRALHKLEPGEQSKLLAAQEHWAGVATRLTPADFAKTLDHEVRRLQQDGGLGLFERQQRNTYLRAGVRGDGMWFLNGAFDPKTGMLLSNRLTAEVERLFTDKTPDTCPSDPFARQEHLRALALASLIQGQGGSRGGRPEWVIIEDRRRPGEPVIDTGMDTHIPDTALAELKAQAAVHHVVVETNGTITAPGQLDLGRQQRLANRPQRRVLQALYTRCAIPHCPVRTPHLKIHHIQPWEHNGSTDLANLLPVCVGHHHKIHDDNWQLTLQPDRTLHINLPDGTTMTTGPPARAPT